jgi:hypothetical protein
MSMLGRALQLFHAWRTASMGTMAGEGGNRREDSGKVSRPVVVPALNVAPPVLL